MRRSLVGSLVILSCLSAADAATWGREWTDNTGKHSVEARLVDFDQRRVRLRKTDGSVIALPIERLSQEDQQYLRSQQATGAHAGQGAGQSPVESFEDLRATMLKRAKKDISSRDLREADLFRTTFGSFTRWPPPRLLPPGFDPGKVLQWGKTPGLGVKALHARGITGKGVHVGIIDQPILRNHQEYAGRVVQYTMVECQDARPAMHGAAVASLLVGSSCGVAPEANLHFWAEPSWKFDYRYRCEALEQLLAYNNSRAPAERIRVVSVSKGFDKQEPNLERWKELLERAEREGLCVIHCAADMYGVGCPVFADKDDPEAYSVSRHPPGRAPRVGGLLCAPSDFVTTAHYEGRDAYIFWSRGGSSWAAPFIAGVAALGLQQNPDLTPQEIREHLYSTGTPFYDGVIINPRGFVEAVAKP